MNFFGRLDLWAVILSLLFFFLTFAACSHQENDSSDDGTTPVDDDSTSTDDDDNDFTPDDDSADDETPMEDDIADDDVNDDDATDDDVSDDDLIDDDSMDDDSVDDDTVGLLPYIELAAGGSPGVNGTTITHSGTGETLIAASYASWLMLYRLKEGQILDEEILAEHALNPSLAQDELGYLHVAYRYPPDNTLRYTTNVSGEWSEEIIAEARKFFRFVLDDSGHAHFIHDHSYSYPYYGFRYTTNASGAWQSYDLFWEHDSLDTLSPSLAIDEQGRAHAVFFIFECNNGGDMCIFHQHLRYTADIAGGATPTTLPYYVVQPEFHPPAAPTALDIDAAGNAHLLFLLDYGQEVSYATNQSGSWVKTVIDEANYSSSNAQNLFIQLDAQEGLHLAYILPAEPALLKYATNLAKSWKITTVDSAVKNISLFVDENQKAHLSYHQYLDGSLCQASNASGSWTQTVLVAAPSAGYGLSLVLDRAGRPHVTYWGGYQPGFHRDLVYAFKLHGDWHFETAVADGWYNHQQVLAVDQNDQAHIVYQVYQSPYTYDLILNHATDPQGLWITEEMAGTEDGRNTAIACDSVGSVHLSFCYVDAYAGSFLQYGQQENNQWSIQNLAGPSSSYFISALIIDQTNRPHLAYSAYGREVSYAVQNGGSWEMETADQAGTLGTIALALDSQEYAHLAYYVETDSNQIILKYATNQTGVWLVETLVDLEDSGGAIAIALDSANHVYICYGDYYDQAIKFVSNASGSWQITPLEIWLEYLSMLGMSAYHDTIHLVYYTEDALWHGVFPTSFFQ